MLLSALGFVWYFGRDVPFTDDWGLIPALVDPGQNLTVNWLWELVGEHRVPVPRLFSLVLLWLGGYDFRAGMVFNVLALGALAAALIWGARRVRGRTAATDILFPLALLHLGLCDLFLRGWMVHFVLPTVLAGVVLLLIVCKKAYLSVPAALLAAVCVVVMIGCGPPGLAYAPALVVWLTYEGGRRWLFAAAVGESLRGLIVVGLAVAVAAVIGLYFRGYKEPGIYQRPSPALLLDTAAQLVTLSFGPAAGRWYPYSGGAIAALALVSIGLIAAAAWRQVQPERGRAVGLLLFLGGTGSLLAGLTLGRASTGWIQIAEPENYAYFEYNVLPLPGLCALYFAWVLYGPLRLGAAVRVGLCVGLALALPVNVQAGLQYGRARCAAWEAFERDLEAGAPPSRLIARHAATALMPGCGHHEELASLMGMLREVGVGRFMDMPADPELTAIPLALEPTRLHEASWDAASQVVATTAPEGRVDFGVFGRRHLVALRIHYVAQEGGRTFIVVWKRREQAHFSFESPQRYEAFGLGYGQTPGEPTSVLVYVDERIDLLGICPDGSKPSTLSLLSIELLVARPTP